MCFLYGGLDGISARSWNPTAINIKSRLLRAWLECPAGQGSLDIVNLLADVWTELSFDAWLPKETSFSLSSHGVAGITFDAMLEGVDYL